MTGVGRRAFVAFLLLIPAVALAWLAFFHMRDGAAVDAAVPVPNYMIAAIAMPNAAYVDAALALETADPRNGEAAVERAEAIMHSGAAKARVAAILADGLSREPASARGWTLLCEAELRSDKKAAARALGQALVLAPRDYWLMEARVQDAALLWPALDPDMQAMALRQTRLLWEEPELRRELLQLLRAPEGVAITARAFANDEDQIRAMNRWLSRERSENPGSP